MVGKNRKNDENMSKREKKFFRELCVISEFNRFVLLRVQPAAPGLKFDAIRGRFRSYRFRYYLIAFKCSEGPFTTA